MSAVIAIDPGLANTGFAFVCSNRVLAVDYCGTKPTGESMWEVDAVSRCDAIARYAEDFVLRCKCVGRVDAIIIEGYASHSTTLSTAMFTTPFLIGWLTRHLNRFPMPVVFQRPVKQGRKSDWDTDWDRYRAEYMGLDEIMDKLPKYKAEHVQSAIRHAIYYLEHE